MGTLRGAAAPSSRAVRLDRSGLVVGDRHVPLYSGAMHYFRLERDAWEPGLRQLRDLGLPIVETYIPWQVHELSRGEYDFGERDNRKDLGAFLDLAHDLGLLVFARPGPHINAELTFFGLPERIVYDRACQARSPKQNPVLNGFPPRMFPVPSYASSTFLNEVGRWYEAVAEVLVPRLWPKGPVALLQVDNEGSYYFRDATYDQDYHPDAIAWWRSFLQQRYDTVEALNEAHGATYRNWEEVVAPTHFRAKNARGLVLHVDWATFREEMITRSLAEMKARMEATGLVGVPTVHNLPLGDQGTAMSSTAIERVVDLVGFDYYHARREHRHIKRRTLILAGSHPLPYAPELGIGAPAWFTPLSNGDSLFTALTALAYGLRGFNLYMAVDRDRWYGAPIDSQGNPRLEARSWKRLMNRLTDVGFHRLTRRAPVALMLPQEYARLSKATSVMGFISPTVLEAVGGNPVEACREDAFGFDGPIQILWWKLLSRFASALTRAQIPFVYIDSDAPEELLRGVQVLIAPAFEFCDPARWKTVTSFADRGGRVVFGPAMPTLDLRMRRQLFEVPRDAKRVLIDRDADADAVVKELSENPTLHQSFPVRPSPLETTVHEDETGAKVVFLMNPLKSAQSAHITLPQPATLEDLMSGDRYSGTTSVEVPIRGWTCRMMSVLDWADSRDRTASEAS